MDFGIKKGFLKQKYARSAKFKALRL